MVGSQAGAPWQRNVEKEAAHLMAARNKSARKSQSQRRGRVARALHSLTQWSLHPAGSPPTSTSGE